MATDGFALTYGGKSLTLAVQTPSNVTGYRNSAIYYLYNPPATGTSTATMPNIAAYIIDAFTLGGVSTTSGIVTGGIDAGAVTKASVTLNGIQAGSFAAIDQTVPTASSGPFAFSATNNGVLSGTGSQLWYYSNGNNTIGAGGYVSGLNAGTNTISGSATSNGSSRNVMSVAVFAPQTGTTTYGSLPVNTALAVASGGTLDLGGANQTVASLSDYLTAGNGGVIQSSGGAATLALSATSAGSTAFSGQITGGISLAMSGSGYQTLAGVNTFTGGTTISSGTLQVGNGATSSGSLGSGNIAVNGGDLVFNGAPGGNVVVNGTIANAGNLVLNGAAGNALTLGGVISGAGSITETGAGLVSLTAANTFTGNLTISGGTLFTNGQASGTANPSSMGDTYTTNNTVTVGSGGVLEWNGGNQTGWGQTNVKTQFVVNGLLIITAAGDNALGTSLTLSGGTLLQSGASAYGALLLNSQAAPDTATLSASGAANSYLGVTANATWGSSWAWPQRPPSASRGPAI